MQSNYLTNKSNYELAYYVGEGHKTPVIIQKKKRVYADVKLLPDVSKPNAWELWEVPLEDLKTTHDFWVSNNALFGDLYHKA
jgi:hypothetical protein|tara:strand:+ start:475 stop:720 length:246 start_codon:yes stop_codon:yes gene_type:complete